MKSDDASLEEFIRLNEKMWGKDKRVVDLETGVAHRVPLRTIIVNGLRQADLHKFPKWEV